MAIKLKPKRSMGFILVPVELTGDTDREQTKGTDKDAKTLKKIKKFMTDRGSVYAISEWNTVRNEKRGMKEMIAFHAKESQILEEALAGFKTGVKK